MSLSEIIFRLFAWVRPLLWYCHRLGHVLEAFLITLDRPCVLERVRHDPERRRQWARIIVDMEHVLDIAIGLRPRELLGHPVQPEARPGFRQHPDRIRIPPDFETPMPCLLRLIERYCDLERLARPRAARIQRKTDTTPAMLGADHQPDDDFAILNSTIPTTTIFSHGLIDVSARSRAAAIRGPPWRPRLPPAS